MRSVRMCVSTDDRIRNGAWWARIKRSARLGLLSAAVVGSITPFAAESADDLKLPASFRGDQRAEAIDPPPDGFVGDDDAPLGQQILHIPEAQREA
jgi:hypothetical protein